MAGESTGMVGRRGGALRRHGQNRKKWFIAVAIAVPVVLGLYILLKPYLRLRQAKQDVDVLALALTGFAQEHQRYPQGTPAHIAALLRGENVAGQNPKKLDYIEAGSHEINAAGEFIDPWGTPYRISTDPAVRVYSCGPNRLDEQGSGDDIASWR